MNPGPPHTLRHALYFLFKRPISVILIVVLLFSLRLFGTLTDAGVLDNASHCELQDVSHTRRENQIYNFLMNHHFRTGSARQVQLVTITEGTEPPNVLTNVCDGRTFLAALVRELGFLGGKTRVIAIDESFSDGSCTDPSVNDSFRRVLEGASVPVVVGERVHKREDNNDSEDCLVENPKFPFRTLSGSTAALLPDNVRTGLLRLNEEVLRIPLFWYVYPNDQAAEGERVAEEKLKGFALVAAQTADPTLATDKQLQRFWQDNEHPYASFVKDFPHWTAMDVLCYGPGKVARLHPEWGNCDKIPHVPFRMRGTVVLIGQQVESDSKPSPYGKVFGVFLHAEYIEALLGSRYAGPVPRLYDEGLLILLLVLSVMLDLLGARAREGPRWFTSVHVAELMAASYACILTLAVVLFFCKSLLMTSVLFGSASVLLLLSGYIFFAGHEVVSSRNKEDAEEVPDA